jgi:hypothetical protein
MLRNALRSACAVALLACFMTGAASAQTFDKRTVFTFSGPVALPGVTLPAGQYLFRLADPTGDRKVVAVLREVVDRKCVGGIWCASARANGINFQACSIDHSDISPFEISDLRAVWI